MKFEREVRTPLLRLLTRTPRARWVRARQGTAEFTAVCQARPTCAVKHFVFVVLLDVRRARLDSHCHDFIACFNLGLDQRAHTLSPHAVSIRARKRPA